MLVTFKEKETKVVHGYVVNKTEVIGNVMYLYLKDRNDIQAILIDNAEWIKIEEIE